MDEIRREYAQLLRTPAGAVAAVTRVRQNDYDFSFLHSLASLTGDIECWRCLREAGIVDVFIDMIVLAPSGESGDKSEFLLWTLPLQGLFNCLVAIHHSPGAFQASENQASLSKLLKTSPLICLQLSRYKEFICTPETHMDGLRRTVILWIHAIWNGTNILSLTDIRSELKNSRIVDLATWCWIFASANELRSKAANALVDIIEQPHPTKQDLDRVIASAGSYDQLFNTILQILQSTDMAAKYLAENLSLLTGFINQTVHTKLARRFSRMKIHYEIMAALRRQLTRPGDGKEVWRVLEYSAMLLVNIVHEAASPTEELTTLIARQSLIPLLGGVSLRLSQASKESPSWSRLIALLKHTCTCTSLSCRVRTSPSYVPVLRTHLSWRWWPTLKRMRLSDSEASTKLQGEWVTLGRTAGLQEATERKKHELGGGEEGVMGCWWAECVRLIDPSDPSLNANLRKCSGCKKALYCTSDCQNRDWKGHKKQCTNWKAAVVAP